MNGRYICMVQVPGGFTTIRHRDSSIEINGQVNGIAVDLHLYGINTKRIFV